ncbi:MAG: preprotein translocase subunit SecG [Gemmatimonadaceae bacterium]
MYTFLITLLVINSLILIAAVLLQSGKGSGLSANFGGSSSSSDSFVGTRQAANLLTRVTWWGGGVFLVLAYVLQIMGTRTRVPTSVLDPLSHQTQSAPIAPSPTNAAPSAVPLTPIAPPAQAPAPPPTKTPPK